MAYSDKARELRRCKALRKDGGRCQGWAMWESVEGLCYKHTPKEEREAIWQDRRLQCFEEGRSIFSASYAKYPPCTCAAYAWPHRPGGGLCRWPDPPTHRSTRRAGTRPAWKERSRKWYQRFRRAWLEPRR